MNTMTENFDFSILLRRKGRIFFTGLVTAVVALGITKVMPRTYTSDGGMIVENSEPVVPELGMGIGNGGAANNGVVLTQLEVLRSRGLIQRVVQKLQLAESPGLIPKLRLPLPLEQAADWLKTEQKYLRSLISSPDPVIEGDDSPTNLAIQYIQKNLKVIATDNSSVISMSFSAANPAIASSVLNGVMNEYLLNDAHRRTDQISQVNQWLVDRTNQLAQDSATASLKVENFVRSHNLPEVQGSSAAAIKLTQDQTHLALAQEALQRDEATLSGVERSGAAGSTAALESKSIQALKEHEAGLVEKIALLASYDPRRLSLQSSLNGVRAQIGAETANVVSSIRHAVEVDRANVQALQAAVTLDSSQSSQISTASTELANLKADAEAKRQMYIAFGSRTEQMRMASSQLPSARILFPAALQPSHPFEMMGMLLGFIVGMVGSSGIFVLRESMSRMITSTGKLELLTGLPVYGSLPEANVKLFGRDTKTESVFAETLRGIWLNLRGITGGSTGGTTVVVTSSEVGEGKTTISTNLARTIANDGYRVLLIDGDLRRPKLSRVLNLKPTHSLEEVLNGSATLKQAVLVDFAYGVDCLLTTSVRNPMKTLSSDAFRSLLSDARNEYDFVVVDSPPVMRVADSVIIGKLCQHILFIVAAGQVTADSVTKAVNRFSQKDRGKILTLLTRVRARDLDQNDYFGGYEALTFEDR